jgi:hypothetical protein
MKRENKIQLLFPIADNAAGTSISSLLSKLLFLHKYFSRRLGDANPDPYHVYFLTPQLDLPNSATRLKDLRQFIATEHQASIKYS